MYESLLFQSTLTKCLCEREAMDVFVVADRYASSIPLYKIEDSSMLPDNEETLRNEIGLGIFFLRKKVDEQKEAKKGTGRGREG